MSRRALAVIASAAAMLAVTGTGASQTAGTKLKGTVGPGFTISLTKAGKRVKTLSAGTYTFVIADKSAMHNFTLEQEKGGKFEKHLTSTAFKGTKTATVKLKRGKWKFYCSVHESSMFGFFTVK